MNSNKERSFFPYPHVDGGGFGRQSSGSERRPIAQGLKSLPELAGVPSDPKKALLTSINGIVEKYRGLAPPEVLNSSIRLVLDARVDALKRVNHTPEVVGMIETALANRVLPYFVEVNIISDQLSLSKSKDFARQTSHFLGNPIVAVITCPDGRIMTVALGDPGVVSFNRRLRGLPPVRKSTEDGIPVLDDPDISGAINFEIEQRTRDGQKAELIELMGPHIFSTHPEHGCGDASGTLGGAGHFRHRAMKFGGIEEYFEQLGDGFFAADNNARRAGGQGTTIDLVHDAHSQGFIVGLREAYKHFSPKLDLRSNLLRLADRREILMTEMLRNTFRIQIREQAAKIGFPYLDITDPTKFADNIVALGTIAQQITEAEEARGFPWIPAHIKNGKSPAALKTLAYLSIRSTVYQELSNITVGNHTLTRHPERLIVAGPLAPIYNVNNIAFIEKTSRGEFKDEDLQGIKKLYGLSEVTMPELGIDLNREGRVIIAIGSYDSGFYADETIARQEWHKTAAIIRNNEARIRAEYRGSVATGETIVMGAVVKPGSRGITNVV